MTAHQATIGAVPSGRRGLVVRSSAFVLTGILTAVAILGLWRPERAALSALASVAFVALGLAGVASGSAVNARLPRHPSGLLLTLGGLCLLSSPAAWWLPEPVVATPAAVGLLVAWPLAVVFFPDGRLPPIFGLLAVAMVLGSGAVAVAASGDVEVLQGTGLVVAMAVFVVGWVRYERGAETDRLALLWLVFGVVTTLMVGGHVAFLAPQPWGSALAVAVSLSIPTSMAVGILSPGFADVRELMVRSTVFFVAAVLVVAFFSAAVDVAVEVNGRRPTTGVLAIFAVVAAAGFQPTRVALMGVVDRLLFGDRSDPVTAASHVGSRLSDDPVIALRALREALAIPYAAVVTDGEVAARSGTATTATSAVPLRIGTECVGELVVGLRPGQVRLAADDAAVLRIVAPAIAQVVFARSLARELQESRSAVITAVEDERRRLRRDLHDGLGPTLTGVAYAADAARNMIAADPARADALLAGLRSDTAGAITEIRRLIEGLRPPALDELGLVRALLQQTAQMYTADGSALQVSVHAPTPMPELPAAVEVAAYRIVLEALTNVARHADCDRASVELDIEGDELVVEVRDSGRGNGDWVPGVGMSSMRERARQLGGTCDVRSTEAGGVVRVSIPLT